MINIENELLNLADVNYKNFNKKICPDTKREILGIKIPTLRTLARKIIKELNWQEWLKISGNTYFEEIILQGFVIAYSPIKFKEKIPLIKKFIPKIDSWAISDSFVPALKIPSNDLNLAFDFIKPYFKSNKEFEIRFAVIMLLYYYITDEYVDEVIRILDNIHHNGYYVKMAVAWCLAEVGIKFNDKLMNFLNGKNNLDKFTYNKTLQKMIESRRFTNEQKNIFREMKIK